MRTQSILEGMSSCTRHSPRSYSSQSLLSPSSSVSQFGFQPTRFRSRRLSLRLHKSLRRIYQKHISICAAQVTKVNSEELQQEITQRTTPLVIDFYATWCGPCLLLAKELEKVAEQLGDTVKILKVDTDENPELSNQLRIEGLPTMVFVGIDPAKPAIRTEGLLPAETILTIIKEELHKLPDVQPDTQPVQ